VSTNFTRAVRHQNYADVPKSWKQNDDTKCTGWKESLPMKRQKQLDESEKMMSQKRSGSLNCNCEIRRDSFF
jgi:hypothetical protein